MKLTVKLAGQQRSLTDFIRSEAFMARHIERNQDGEFDIKLLLVIGV